MPQMTERDYSQHSKIPITKGRHRPLIAIACKKCVFDPMALANGLCTGKHHGKISGFFVVIFRKIPFIYQMVHFFP